MLYTCALPAACGLAKGGACAYTAPEFCNGGHMPVLVMKFGGTSVATLDRIRRAAKRVGVEVAKGYDVIVIVSAMSGKTNELVGWVNETSPLYDAREYDAVVSSGENVTAGLMALTLQEMDVPARSWQGWQVPVKTTSAHSSEIGRAHV